MDNRPSRQITCAPQAPVPVEKKRRFSGIDATGPPRLPVCGEGEETIWINPKYYQRVGKSVNERLRSYNTEHIPRLPNNCTDIFGRCHQEQRSYTQAFPQVWISDFYK